LGQVFVAFFHSPQVFKVNLHWRSFLAKTSAMATVTN
jgi:hypothetical protein